MNVRLLPARPPARAIDPIVRILASIGVTPAALTTAGLVGNVLAAALIVQGSLLAGGIVVLLASALDMLDGALARATGSASRFGAMFDSVLDRFSEAVVLFGIAWYGVERGDTEVVVLAFAAVVGSLMVSYVRARAEGLNLQLRDGIFTRAERVVLTGAMLILGYVTIGLWVLATLSLFTAFQRLWIASRMLLEADAPPKPPRPVTAPKNAKPEPRR
ncbi:MAG: CDP-alcohol phosphatidyltransferase family protein [Dehalococcoidia bacterium]